MTAPLLRIADYSLAFDGYAGRAHVLSDVSLVLAPGETIGIVGETGCGKSVLARSIMALNPSPPVRWMGGQVNIAGIEVGTISKSDLREVRGGIVAMIFQDPMAYLNPLLTVGQLFGDILRAHHRRQGRREASASLFAEGADLLRATGLNDPERVWKSYPHELSGRMRQRVLIAMALSGRPQLLMADEPTTALDVTVQAQVLELIARLVRERSMALVLISHDLGVVNAACNRVVVMYAGTIVEDDV